MLIKLSCLLYLTAHKAAAWTSSLALIAKVVLNNVHTFSAAAHFKWRALEFLISVEFDYYDLFKRITLLKSHNYCWVTVFALRRLRTHGFLHFDRHTVVRFTSLDIVLLSKICQHAYHSAFAQYEWCCLFF